MQSRMEKARSAVDRSSFLQLRVLSSPGFVKVTHALPDLTTVTACTEESASL